MCVLLLPPGVDRAKPHSKKKMEKLIIQKLQLAPLVLDCRYSRTIVYSSSTVEDFFCGGMYAK